MIAQEFEINFADAKQLTDAYLPFVKNGAVFVATEQVFSMGDRVVVRLTVFDDPQEYLIQGNVVWVTRKSILGNQAAGIGVQIDRENADILRKKFESYI